MLADKGVDIVAKVAEGLARRTVGANAHGEHRHRLAIIAHLLEVKVLHRASLDPKRQGLRGVAIGILVARLNAKDADKGVRVGLLNDAVLRQDLGSPVAESLLGNLAVLAHDQGAIGILDTGGHLSQRGHARTGRRSRAGGKGRSELVLVEGGHGKQSRKQSSNGVKSNQRRRSKFFC